MSEIAQQDAAFQQVPQKPGAGGPVLLQGQAGLREQAKREGAVKQQTLLCAACHTSYIHFLG